MNCCDLGSVEIIKEYDPKPKNPDGSIRWFLYRWDDGKDGIRKLVRCRDCGKYYLIQSYHLNKFSDKRNVLFEDWYEVRDECQADNFNSMYTGIQLEREIDPAFHFEINTT